MSGSRLTSKRRRTSSANAGARSASLASVATSIFTLLRALDTSDAIEKFFEKFVAHFDFLEDQFHVDWKKAHIEIAKHMEKFNIEDNPENFLRASQETAWLEIYRRARPGEVQTVEAARWVLRGMRSSPGEALRPVSRRPPVQFRPCSVTKSPRTLSPSVTC